MLSLPPLVVITRTIERLPVLLIAEAVTFTTPAADPVVTVAVAVIPGFNPATASLKSKVTV